MADKTASREAEVKITLEAIGFVRGGRHEIVDDDWGGVEAEIALDPARFTPEALAGLESFSHLEVLYHFHLVPEAKIETGARHPRGRQDWPLIGIFAQRGKNRPNRLGSTVCELLGVTGTKLRVRGLDAIDETPVLDLKPFMTGFRPRGIVREPAWATELMAGYWSSATPR
jgi:tRNA-Thr(GGU) m(6)t(6)A37 methyltransferase TsaA